MKPEIKDSIEVMPGPIFSGDQLVNRLHLLADNLSSCIDDPVRMAELRPYLDNECKHLAPMLNNVLNPQ